MMKVKEYIANTTLPFILNDDIDSNVPWKTSDFQATLKDYINIHYGSLRIRRSLEDSEDIASFIKYMCSNTYRVNAYKYEHLYSTTIAVYDPIENYRMVETESSTHSDSESGTFTKGTQSDTQTKENVFGSKQDDLLSSITNGSYTDTSSERTDYGATTIDEDVTTTNGAQTNSTDNTKTYGDVTTREEGIETNAAITNTHYATTYENDVLHVENKDEQSPKNTKIIHGQDTDSTSESIGSRTDQVVRNFDTNAHTDEKAITDTHGSSVDTKEDTYSYGGHTDSESVSVSSGERQDTDAKTMEGESTRELTRSGNIGVTTSQQMIESEREVAMFNFYNVVAKDIIKLISTRVYGGC